jgi:hypothetical protein
LRKWVSDKRRKLGRGRREKGGKNVVLAAAYVATVAVGVALWAAGLGMQEGVSTGLGNVFQFWGTAGSVA